MAIWQYNFFIIPNMSQFNFTDFKLEKDNDNLFDDSEFWRLIPTKCSVFDSVSKVLPKGISWSKSIVLFGAEDSSRLQILCENGIVEGVSFRIDFLSDYTSFLICIFDVCSNNDFLIVNQDLKVVHHNLQEIETMVMESAQYKKYIKLSR